MEEQITLKKSDLEALIAKEVAKTLTKKKKNDFRDVRIELDDISQINKKHPKILEKIIAPFEYKTGETIRPVVPTFLRDSNLGLDSYLYSKRRFFEYSHHAYHHAKPCVCVSAIHDLLKKLALYNHGVSIISDLDDDEFQEVLKTYQDFKELFLKKYDERLEKQESKEI